MIKYYKKQYLGSGAIFWLIIFSIPAFVSYYMMIFNEIVYIIPFIISSIIPFIAVIGFIEDYIEHREL